MKMKRGIISTALRLRMDPLTLIDETQKAHICADSLISDYIGVNINGVVWNTVGVAQTIAVLTLGFIAFNLKHQVPFEDLLEIIEHFCKIRKKITKIRTKSLAMLAHKSV